MKPSTIDMLRAYLMTVSLAAVGMQIVMLVCLVVFGVSEQVFEAAPFRLAVAVIIVFATLATKHIAHAAFRFAVAHRHATYGDARVQIISVSRGCPVRMLVILHLRFSRRLFDLVES